MPVVQAYSSEKADRKVFFKRLFGGNWKKTKDEQKLSISPDADLKDTSDTASEGNASVESQKEQEVVSLVSNHFPGAMPGSKVLEKTAVITENKLGLTDDNTLFAQSICPDEINHEEGDIPNLYAEFFGEVFHLGGLAGIPFTGKTGFAAFSHHAPEKGHAFILAAPHIGISDTLCLGKYTRDGQTGEGSACGAAVGALCYCCSHDTIPTVSECVDDMQMTFLINAINKRKERILKASNENTKQANLVHEAHDLTKSTLDRIVSTDFGDDNTTLTVLSGVQINMPRPFEDYFQPLCFEIHRKDGTVTDLFEETFGYKSPLSNNTSS